MSAAIDRYRPAGLPAVIELLGGNVACTLRITERGTRRGEPSHCSVQLANKAQVPVTGRLYGIDRRKRTRDFGQITVMPYGLGNSSFMLPAIADECERVYLEVSGTGIRLAGDAPIPAAVRNTPRSLIVTGAVILAFGIALAATAFLVVRPAITALGIPKSAGYGSGSFLVAAGQAPREASAKPLAFITAPVIHRALPRIGYFSAHRETYAGKTSVLASYLASGTSGTLRVLDEQGRLLGSSPFSHVGTSRIALATDPGPQALRAEIDVAGADSHTSAAVEIPAGTGTGLGTGDAAEAVGADTAATGADGGSASAPSDPFFVDQRVVAGREFVIAIRHPMPNLRIVLQTTTGATIDEVLVPPGARAVTLRAPASSMVEIYYLAGTFNRLSAEETVIRSLRIYPD